MAFVVGDSLFQHFEDLVAGHFRECGRAILAACKYYMEGHEVGSKVPEEDKDKKESQDGEGSSSSSMALTQQNKPAFRTNRNASFKPNLEVLFEELLMEFNVKGADTAKFRAQKLKNQQVAAWTEWFEQQISSNFWGSIMEWEANEAVGFAFAWP